MGVIQVLDDFTIDKIAAGEVIERPASVVKELVENAMDSGATSITIEIKEGGISFIRITDNGSGIAAEDVPAAFLRHATSKIRSAEDLLHIHSLGFRGEALSSIAAVAQVELITKTGKALTGVRYLIAGGKESALEHIGCPEGTTFIVRNLFYNVPARQKFLKTPQTEGAHIYDLIQQLALSHPEISFQFIMNGQNRFHTSGNGNIKDILYTIYGKEVARSLLPIELRDETLTLHITGYIGKPIISRGNRSYENYYINQRYVKSNVIYKAVEDAYKTFTMIHRFPFVCLNFTIDPGQMDVNVHPSKMELRFKQERRLYEVLKNAIRQTLLTKDLIPTASVSPEQKKKVVIEKSAPVGAQPFETARKTVEKRLEERPLSSMEKPAEKRVAMPVTEQVQEALVKPEQAQAAVAAAKETAQIPVSFQKEIQTTAATAPKEPKPLRVEEQASYTAAAEIPEEKPKKPEAPLSFAKQEEEAQKKAQEEAAKQASASTGNNTSGSSSNNNSSSKPSNSGSNNNSGSSSSNGKYNIPSGGLTPSKGRIWFNGHTETYYSQKVLPGAGLNIPGRHIASDGTIRDKDGYIVLASDDYPKGTVVETSLGAGKVYDSGSGKGNIDLYTDW